MSEYKISLCMIVKNEEKHLRRCLSSIQNIVDEIIIVDTGSTDSTVTIAEEFDAKVFGFSWENDFSAARNFSISQATCDYILVLDADEYLDADTDLKVEVDSGVDFFSVNIKNYDSNGITSYHQAVRLFKRRADLYYYGRLHEHLNVNDKNLHLTSKNAEFIIHHVGYLEETILEKNKLARNLNIMLKEVEENPTPYSLFNLGNSFFNNNRLEEALEMYKKSFSMKNNVTYIYSLLCRMIETLRLLKRYGEAIELAHASIDRFPLYTDFYLLLGRIYEEYNFLKDAEMMYKKCIELGDAKDVSFSLEGAGSYLPYLHLADLYIKQGKPDDAFEAAYKSFEYNKHFVPSLKIYLKIMSNSGVSKADMFSHLRKIYPFDDLEDIKSLLVALYNTRHPLLNLYISANEKADINVKIRAVAKLYDKQYADSLTEWMQVGQIEESNILDVILLALLLNNIELLDKCEGVCNATKKEWGFIKKLASYSEITTYKPTAWTEKILLELCERLITLEEFDVFEYTSYFILQGTRDTKIELAKILYNCNFYDSSVDLLSGLIETDSFNRDVIKLLVKNYIKLNQFDEAEQHLFKLAKNTDDIATYETLYDIYEKSGKIHEKTTLKSKMAELFPLSMWVRQLQETC